MTTEFESRLLGGERRDAGGTARLVAAVVLCAAIIALTVVNSLFSLCLVDGDSMNPTLEDGQYVTLYNNFTPERGDMVVFASGAYGEPLIKRVVATAGQTVSLRYTQGDELALYVDGAKVEENYLGEPMRDDYVRHGGIMLYPGMTATVPDGCVFVLGDNRNNSTDSRFSSVGYVKIDDIIGEVAAEIAPGGITEFFVRLFMGGL